MRDIGILVWVALLIIGVGGSMISSVRRQMQGAQGRASGIRPARPQQLAQAPAAAPRQTQPAAPVTQPPPEWLQRMAQQVQTAGAAQPPLAPMKPAPPPRPQPKPAATPPPLPWPGETHAPHQNRSATGARFLGNKRSVVQAMIAAEVLGKPRAFNDEYLPH
jgi:hypothetical protein